MTFRLMNRLFLEIDRLIEVSEIQVSWNHIGL